MEETKQCSCCGKELPISSFKRSRWGYVGVCRECEINHRREKKRSRLDEKRKKIEELKAESRKLCLNDFSPRELMEELARRGYKVKLTYTRVEEINIENF